MKGMFMKLLRALHIDVALLGLIEKLSLGLVKKFTALSQKARNSLNRALQLRNEKKLKKTAKKASLTLLTSEQVRVEVSTDTQTDVTVENKTIVTET